MTVDSDVDRLLAERPAEELLRPQYDSKALAVADGIFRSSGTTASYLVDAGHAGRVIVNCGMGFEAPHHKRLFDEVCAGPTPYIITTQAHVDHVGGVRLFRDQDTRYVAQSANRLCQEEDARIASLRRRTAPIWFDLAAEAARIASENIGIDARQDKPMPDLTFDHQLGLRVGDLAIECISMPGGETVDTSIVWLPDRGIALISNMLGPLFPHFPNLNTLRGDRYRWVEPYLSSVRALRELRPTMLITGRHLPIIGKELIEASLTRLHDAVEYVHNETIAGINAGEDLGLLMERIRLPPHLRVGQAYGKVPWAVRTIWESYVGWFKLRSTTELYADTAPEAMSELVSLAGVTEVIERAQRLLSAHLPLRAIHFAEGVLRIDPTNVIAAHLMVDAHQELLDSGGSSNFWEAGWLRAQQNRWLKVIESTTEAKASSGGPSSPGSVPPPTLGVVKYSRVRLYMSISF